MASATTGPAGAYALWPQRWSAPGGGRPGAAPQRAMLRSAPWCAPAAAPKRCSPQPRPARTRRDDVAVGQNEAASLVHHKPAHLRQASGRRWMEMEREHLGAGPWHGREAGPDHGPCIAEGPRLGCTSVAPAARAGSCQHACPLPMPIAPCGIAAACRLCVESPARRKAQIHVNSRHATAQRCALAAAQSAGIARRGGRPVGGCMHVTHAWHGVERHAAPRLRDL